MTTDRQRRTNARNAKKSTGPTSAAGKERVSRNARTHGLTTPPPVEDVLTYYRIIMEDAEADPSVARTAAEVAALRLAQCEAACDRALDAETKALEDMAIYLKTKGERDVLKLVETSKDLDLENPAVLQMLMRNSEPEDMIEPTNDAQDDAEEIDGALSEEEAVDFTRGALRILYNINRHNLARRRRRLERIAVYRQRAEGRRRRALKAWCRAKYKNDNSNPITRIG